MPLGNISPSAPNESLPSYPSKEDTNFIPVKFKKTSPDGHIFKQIHSEMSQEKLNKAHAEGRIGLAELNKSGEVIGIKVSNTINGALRNHNINQFQLKRTTGQNITFSMSNVKIQTLTGSESIYLNNAVNKMLLAIQEARNEKEEKERKENRENSRPKLLNHIEIKTNTPTLEHSDSIKVKTSDFLIPMTNKSNLNSMIFSFLLAKKARAVREQREEKRAYDKSVELTHQIIKESNKKFDIQTDLKKADTFIYNFISYLRKSHQKAA